jgi:S-disulfanyl-L-cysteine oxidoreductase SoxD
MIPPGGYLRRVIITLLIVSVPLLVGMAFTYDVIKINWASNMEFQPSVKAQEGPRLSAPADSVPFEGASLPKDGKQPENPVPPDPVSLERGKQLFLRNCALCHGESGQGNGPVTQQWQADAKKPANLTDARMAQQSDGSLYLTISEGYGAMPALNENLNVRERWDVVNYVKSLSQSPGAQP